MNNLSELIAQIIAKEPKKVYDKANPFYGQAYFKLKVLTEDNEKAIFFVYPNLVSPSLFKVIKESQYATKKYLLQGEKRKKGFLLRS
jgi:hypothetical protein